MNHLTHQPNLYPGIPMSRFGTTPYQENLFRIVFSDSRRYTVSGQWPDGSVCASEEKLYLTHPNTWVLERWVDAREFAGCSRETWDWKYQNLGPYPERGEYQAVHFFETVQPIDCSMEKLISWIEQGRKNSFQTVLDGCQAAYDYEKQEKQRVSYDRIYDSLSAHLDYAMVGPYAKRGTKTQEMRISAAQTGMPQFRPHVAENDIGLATKFGTVQPRRRKRAA